jgi:hypothetical protein
MRVKDRHHRKPRSIGGKNNKENVSILPRKKHVAWHVLFQNYDAPTIAEVINQFYLDPDWFMVAVPRRNYGTPSTGAMPKPRRLAREHHG